MFWLIGAELLVNVGRGILTLALGLFLYRTTGNVWAFALAFSSEFAFSLVMQGLAGATADRFNAADVLAVTSGACALLFGLVLGGAALAPTGSLEGSVALAMLLSVGLNVARPFLRASLFAVIHRAVDERGYERLNGHLAVALQVGQLAGMAAAGLLLESLRASHIFAIVGLFHLGAALCHLELRRWIARRGAASPQHGATASRNATLSTVIAHVRSNPEVLSLCAIASVDVALVALFNLALAPVVQTHFDGRLLWMTVFDVSFAVGALLGGGYVSARRSPLGIRATPTLAAAAAGGATFAGFALAAPVAVLLPAIAVFGFLATVSTVMWQAGLQLIAPTKMKGRLGSLRLLCNSIVIAGATLLASYVADARLLGVPAFSAAFALVSMAAMALLYAASRPGLERLQPVSSPSERGA
jgi:MFS family permease